MNLAVRLRSLDVARGLVMVLMAVDHVRVYAGLPPGGPTPGIFFTRWITHFCAPAFVFLAGASAHLHGARLGDRAALSRFLATRGLWLVLLELTVVRLAWTFNFQFDQFLLAGVIWVLGWSMVVLAGLVWMPLWVSAAFGGLLVFGHNMLPRGGGGAAPSWAWQLLYAGGGVQLGAEGPTLFVLYVLVPWVGVMALGYVFGGVLRLEPAARDRACRGLGLGLLALFVLGRATNLYGDPQPWPQEGMPAPLAFLNTAKYPASLLFLCMTLGPLLALLPTLERARGRVAEGLVTFGKVPLFYYLLHIPLIHLLALLYTAVRMPEALLWQFANHPIFVPEPPPGYPWSLGMLYLMTAVAVAILYPACRWFAGVKARGGSRFLSYL